MNNIILPSLLTFAFSVAGFSQTIIRTATINLNNSAATSLGSYNLEIQSEKVQLGAGIHRLLTKSLMGEPEVQNQYRCTETLILNKDVIMTYILKNSAGQEIDRQTVRPNLQVSLSEDTSKVAACRHLFATRVGSYFSHALDYVHFKTADGILSVGTSFSAYVVSDESFTAYINEESLTRIQYLLNNKNSKQAPLIDPANPPVDGVSCAGASDC